ncbi:putative reverse transcriptase domain-containing protein, partial [Tanacetum coccineum]
MLDESSCFRTIPTTIPDTTPVITSPTTQTNTIVIPTKTPIISPTIPPSLDYTPASPDYSPTSDYESDPSEDPSSDHIPPLPTISLFLSSADDTTDSNTPDTPPLPTHGTPFIEITSSTQRSHVIPHRRVMILAPRQPIPYGRPYRYHLNGPVHMLTARKRVGPLLAQQLAASSDFHSDASSDSSSLDLPSTTTGPSRKRRMSPMTFVPELPLVSEALSPVSADLIPSPKRVRDSGYLADVEVDPRETSLRDDVIVRDALRDRGIDARVVVEAVDRDESETGARGPIEVRVKRVTHSAMPKDIPEPAQEGAVKVIEGVQRDQGHRIVGVESAVTAITERIAELERDNRRLKGIASVESQRVDRLQRGMSRNGANGNGGNRGNGNGGNGANGNKRNGENGNGNKNMNHSMNYGGFMPVARECTFQDFLKRKPQNFSGTKGVFGLTAGLIKWRKMETELWNLTVKGNDLTTYTQRFQELILLCMRMVPDEEDKVKRFIGGFPDNIQGNVIAAEPTKLQDAIRIANNLMDQKLKGYARSAENKRRLENNLRENHGLSLCRVVHS